MPDEPDAMPTSMGARVVNRPIDSSPGLAPVRSVALAELPVAGAGLLVVLVASLFVDSSLLWIVPPALASLLVLLVVAARLAAAGRLLPAVGAVTCGNWVVALVVPIALPFLWPVMVLVVVMPLVLAAPFVPLRALVLMIVGAGGVGAAVALVGLGADDRGAIPDIGDDVELVLVVGLLAVIMAPIALIVWWNNRSQRIALDTALALNAELERSQAQLVESRRRVVEAGDAARSRIERDLHDGVQQQIVAIGMKSRLLASRLDATGPPGAASEGDADRALVAGLVDDVDRAVESLRELAHGIYPPVLEAHGLGDALDAAARRSVDLVFVDDGLAGRRLGRTIEEALYFTALEAMANAAKHAPGATVRVSVATVGEDDRVELRIADDGPGWAGSGASSSGGLANMRDRIESLGGVLELTSPPGGGAALCALVDLDEREA